MPLLLLWACASAVSARAVMPVVGSPPGVVSRFWLRDRATQRIHYEVAEPQRAADADALPLLCLNGFGVGSFHWHRNMGALATERRVYVMDYLGQGASWPVDCADGGAESEAGKRYGIDEWIEQTVDFIDEIVGGRCHLAGNSVGGLIGALIAARHPERAASLCLLNATPVWGLNLPGWDARLPAPPIPRAIGAAAFDAMRSTANIDELLQRTYVSSEALGEIGAHIRRVTDASDGGHAAFASILWSPPASLPPGCRTFTDALRAVDCRVLLLYGADDEWCGAPFGRAALLALDERAPRRSQQQPGGEGRKSNLQQLIELSPAGHCPHHEAPAAVNDILGRWLANEAPVQVVPRGRGADGESDEVGRGDVGEGAGSALGGGAVYEGVRAYAVSVEEAASRSAWDTLLTRLVQ